MADHCQPCFERREVKRPVFKVVAGTPMCEPCFTGKGTDAEMGGHSSSLRRVKLTPKQILQRKVENQRRYRATHREEIRAAGCRYYQKNREACIDYSRRYHARKKAEAAQ